MTITTPLSNETIRLETLTPYNVNENYHLWLNNPETNRFLEVRFSPPKNIRELLVFIETANISSDLLLLGIFTQESNVHIGNVKLGPIDWRHKRGDLGFIIGERSFQGHGFASISINLLLEYTFTVLELEKVTAGCYASNIASARTLSKTGFVLEGILKNHWYCDGRPVDGQLWSRFGPTEVK